MDPIFHTLLAVAALAAAYYGGAFVAKRQLAECAVDCILSQLHDDGYIKATVNAEGNFTLVPIAEVIREDRKATE